MSEGLGAYPEYRESGVAWLGAVPEHWQVLPLRRVTRSRCDGPFGSGLKSSHYTDVGVRVVRLQNIGQAEFRDAAKAYIALDYYALLGDHDVVAGDVLIAGLGDERHPTGRACVAPAGIEPAMVKADCFRFRLDQSRVLPAFAAYQLTATAAEASAVLSVGATRQRINLQSAGTREIALPSVDEQAIIVRYLDIADRRIRRYVRAKQRLIALLEEQKRLVVHRAVTRGLDPDAPLKPSGVEWLGDVPAHWRIHKLSRLARVGNGSTPARTNAAYWLGGTHPWLNSGSVNESPVTRASDFVTDLALRECHLPSVRAGSVLVAITGQGKTRGTSAVLRMDATVNQHLAYLTPRGGGCTADYLHLALQGAYRVLRALSEDAGSTKGAITCESLGRFSIAVPPPEEQRTIVDHVARATRTASAAIAAAGRDIALVTEYRTRLVADVVTGKLDVRAAAARLPNDSEEPDAPPLDDADALDADVPEDAALEPAEA